MPKYDYNEIFEDGIGRERRVGGKSKRDYLAVEVGVILGVIVVALIIIFYGFK